MLILCTVCIKNRHIKLLAPCATENIDKGVSCTTRIGLQYVSAVHNQCDPKHRRRIECGNHGKVQSVTDHVCMCVCVCARARTHARPSIPVQKVVECGAEKCDASLIKSGCAHGQKEHQLQRFRQPGIRTSWTWTRAPPCVWPTQCRLR
jgi:hypothetical protein